MDENLHDIDKLFKVAFDKHDEDPSPHVWNNIDKDLDKKKVAFIYRKYKKLKWVAAALFIFSTGMAMYTWHTRMVNKGLVENNSRSKNRIRQDNSIKDSVNKVESFRTKRDSIQSKRAVAVNQMTGNKNPPGAIGGLDKNKRENENTDIAKSSNKRHYYPQIASSAAKKSELSGKKDIKVNNKGESFKNDFVLNKNNSFSGSTKTDAGKTTINARDKSSASPKEFVADLKVINLNANSYSLSGLSKIEVDTVLANRVPLSVINTEGNKNAKMRKTSVKPLKNSSLSFTVFGSPDFVGKRVDNDHPRFRENERNEIKKSERNPVSSTAGFLVDYSFIKNWSIESGLTFTHLVTNIEPKQIFARPDERGNVNYRFDFSCGYSYIPYRSPQAPTSGDSVRTMSSKNSLQYIGVPIGVRYYISKGKFTLAPGISIAANFITQAKLETEIAGLAGSQKESITSINGLSKNYFNGSLSVGVNYHLNKTFALTFIPVSRFALSSITKEANIKTYLNSLSLAAGLTIKL